MADLTKVKCGDGIKVPVKVIEIDDSEFPVRVAYGAVRFWLDPIDFEAAEHIPAPRVWPISSWVKHTEDISCGAVDIQDCCGYCESKRIKRHGLVCNQEGKMVAVFWRDTGLETMFADELEPDEAPE